MPQDTDIEYRNGTVDYSATATVAVSGTTSAEVDLVGFTLCGIFVPSNFDGSDITFTASNATGGTFLVVQGAITASTAYTIVTTASRYVPIDPSIFAGLRFIKVVTATSVSTTDTVFTLARRPV